MGDPTEKEELKALKIKILEDGIIEESEVKEIETHLLADGKIDKLEADFLFELKDNAKSMNPRFAVLFSDCIADFLLGDDTSPGVIDENEVKWFLEKVGEDGKVDDIEKMTIENLRKKCPNGIPQSFLNLL